MIVNHVEDTKYRDVSSILSLGIPSEVLNVDKLLCHHVKLPDQRKDFFLEFNANKSMTQEIKITVDVRSNHYVNNFGLSPQTHRDMHIKRKLFFSNATSGHLIFLYGNLASLSLQMSEQHFRLGNNRQNFSGMFRLYFGQTDNKKFGTLLDISPQLTCENIIHMKEHNRWCFYRCLNYTVDINRDHRHHYTYVFHLDMDSQRLSCHPPISKNWIRNEDCDNANETIRYLKGSWNEAANVCAKLGGYLPIIRSKDEQDELISILKLPSITPPLMNIIFIGLRNYKV